MAASLGYITAPWCALHRMWWTKVLINPNLLQKCNLLCQSNHPKNLPRCPGSKLFGQDQESLSIRHGRWKLLLHYYTHSWTQETTRIFWTKICNSCIQKSFWRSMRCWNLHTSTFIWILGQHSYQRRFKESLTEILSRTHRPQHSNSWTSTIFLLCPANGLLCGQHDFPNYFKKQFLDTLGSIAFVLEFCGIYSSCCLFIKPIVDLIVMV